MSQHFLLSAKARTLSLASVARMTEEQARETFQRLRWSDNAGEAYCPKCGCTALYTYKTRNLWKCKGCNHQFSVTSGTIFASRKMPVRDILLAIAIFANGAKGHSALQLSRDLDCQYKSAYVLAHKIREALASGDISATASGHVEVDGCYIGGHIRPANYKENRRDRRLATHQTGKRRVVIVMRERNGKTLTFVAKTEDASVATVSQRIAPGSTVYADEATHWDALHARFETRRINHSLAYSTNEACTNLAESFFSRLRRAEAGIHHHISGPYLASYAAEMDWREDNRRISNGEQFGMMIAATMAHPVSRQWKGYWQRSAT
jgi:transposase-like protein